MPWSINRRRHSGACGWGWDWASQVASRWAIFGRTSIRALLRPTVVFFHASATNGDLRPAAAFLGTFVAFLFSAVCVCVFGSCRLYNYYGVPNYTMNKCYLRLHLFSCVPLISLSLISVLGPVLAGPGLFIALSLLSLMWCAKQGSRYVVSHDCAWNWVHWHAAVSRCNAAGAHSRALHMGGIMLCQCMEWCLCPAWFAITTSL